MRQVQARLVILSVAAVATLGAVHWIDGLDTRLREQCALELSRRLVRARLDQAEPDSRELAVRELPAPDGGSGLLAVSAGDQPFVRWTSLAMACLAVLSCWLAAAGVLALARPLPLPEPRLEPTPPAPATSPLTSAATHLNHHLNNAFAVVIGNLEVLRDDAADPERQTLLDDVVGHAWHASGILRRFQRACLREPLARAAAVDLQDAAREAVTRVGPVVRDRRLVLRNLAGATVAGLPGDLVELLTALLENAVEATDSGDRIACEAERRGEHVVLTVSDNGRGMTESVRQQAAQFFYTTRGPQAVGLGLTAVDGIVTRHGGRWWLDSSPGAGCVVTVVLPAGPR